MVSVAKELSRLGWQVPLLIGGATTSPAHTAVKIAPEYPPGVVHVLDASRVVNVVSALLSPEQRTPSCSATRQKQDATRLEFSERRAARRLLPLEAARARRFTCDWGSADLPRP